ncbi:MAG: hypothetical protein K0U20_08710 [Proteobacteria bacterium]|nr:hypothetical protein [Pseudomonadota bacterium]
MKNDNIIEVIADAVITTRDFCGNETEAMLDTAFDMGVRLTAKGRRAVMAVVNNKWADFQKAAGVVRPIDCYERITVNKNINSGV